MVFCVDFDGTLVENAWPEIGEPKWSVVNKVKQLQEQGHIILLWTCRENQALQNALDFCKNVLKLDIIYANVNLPELNELYGNDSRKLGADYYVDDRNLSLDEFINFKV